MGVCLTLQGILTFKLTHVVCRYRVWRTSYDSISVQKNSKEAFRRLWQISHNEESGDSPGNTDGCNPDESHGVRSAVGDNAASPLEIAESNSTSGTIYDRMVARAQTKACGLMLSRLDAGLAPEPHSHFPDHSENCSCPRCRAAASLLEGRLKYSNTQAKNVLHHEQCITPFELALVMLYVHSIDKADQKSLSHGLAFEDADKRFIAALEVVETMMKLDDERARRQSKKPREGKTGKVGKAEVAVTSQTNADAGNPSISAIRKQSFVGTRASNGSRRATVIASHHEEAPVDKQQSPVNEDAEESKQKDEEEIERLRMLQCKKASHECQSVSEVHLKYYSSSIIKGAVLCTVFCAIIVFVSIWMAASPSIELSVWQSSMHDSFTTIDSHSTIYDFDNLDGCLKWLSSNITAPFPENAFTRQLGSAHLRVLRVNSQTQTCSGSDGLLCIPTLDLSQRLGKAGNELPTDMYSSDPPTFSVPGHTSSFVYSDIVAPSTCGKLYCFDGSGYTFKADTTAALAAATRSNIFDANVRAIILTFAVYSPSLQSLYKGESENEILFAQ